MSLFSRKRATKPAPASEMRFFEALKSLREVARPESLNSGHSSSSAMAQNEAYNFVLLLAALGEGDLFIIFLGHGSGLSPNGSNSSSK